jgi:hypothetical protein
METRKDPVPKRNERPLMGLTSSKNFVETNKGDAKHAGKFLFCSDLYLISQLPDILRKRK